MIDLEKWQSDMEEELSSFLGSLPADLESEMDYSTESLEYLEAYLLSLYDGPGAIDLKGKDALFFDRVARYVGEVIRRPINGVWTIDMEDEENILFGVPQIATSSGQTFGLAPLYKVTSSIDRRRGNHLRKIAERFIEKGDKK